MQKFAELILDIKSEKEKEALEKLKEFEGNRHLNKNNKFIELCFCILVANANLEKTKAIWEKIGNGFLKLNREQLTKELKKHGYRFYNLRAKFIVEAREKIDEIENALKSKDEDEARNWLKENIKGLGWKESSHYLRNLGYKNFGILDTHVVSIMHRHGLVDNIPKSLSSRKVYFSMEEKLKEISNMLGISMAELDFYMFYLDSGKMPRK
ncbi:MAG: N-glycosylase/DNA lyase [Candidatus Micrarchaeota archaeon]|nr:N-glycosylase/DNA lyase [Candidatus Micrarchaeota archaeon]